MHEALDRNEDETLAELQCMLVEFMGLESDSEVVPVGDAGYIVRLGGSEPVPGADMVLCDVDDTLIPCTEAKREWPVNYQRYLQSLGLSVDDRQSAEVMNATNAFARWEEQGLNTYHFATHVAALDWSTRQLQDAGPEGISQLIAELPERLVAANGLLGYDPLNTIRDDVFGTVLRPSVYKNTAAAMRAIKAHRPMLNFGLFTLGTPPFQLEKSLEALAAEAADGQPLPISYILLTTVPKGDYMQEFAAMADECPWIATEIFNEKPRVIMLADDSKDQVVNYEATSPAPHIALTALHIVQRNSKSFKRHGYQPDFDGWHADKPGAPDEIMPHIIGRLSLGLNQLLVTHGEMPDEDKVAVLERIKHYEQLAA